MLSQVSRQVHSDLCAGAASQQDAQLMTRLEGRGRERQQRQGPGHGKGRKAQATKPKPKMKRLFPDDEKVCSYCVGYIENGLLIMDVFYDMCEVLRC